jgi:SPP1 gp7 family putative phage head morphogenesis protein
MADVIVEFEPEELPASMTNQITNGLIIQGAPLIFWWQRQSRNLQNNFMDQVRMSLEAGESTQQATTRIVGGTIDGVAVPGIMKTSRRQAEALVRTAINEIVTQTRLNTFQDMDDVVKAIQQISTLDGRTSDICIAYSGLVWDIDTLDPIGHSLPFNDGPPRHFNCRSSIVPVLRSFEELGIDATEVPLATRASMDGEVPGDISFDKWLRGKGTTFQDNLLGPTRAKLWRNGDITLTQLVDMRGNPMTLDQLEDVVGRSLN